MRKIRLEKGITLIALIITIVVLLIISVVTIGNIQGSRIINHAQNARERYMIEKMSEKVKLDQAEMKMAEHGKEITVIDIIKKYEGEEATVEPVSIASNAKSVPENMPEGEYYVITPEKYAFDNIENNTRRYAKLTARGEEREENILKDVYVINEQLDIYYIIEASLILDDTENVEPEQPDVGEDAIDYEAIATALTGVLSGSEDFSESVTLQILKDNGAIEEDEDNIMNVILNRSFAGSPYYEEDVIMTIYFEKIDASYKLKDNMAVSYFEADELESKIIKCAYISKKVLENIFLGETEVPADLIPSDIEKLTKDDVKQKAFLDYIVNNSNGRIKSIDKIAYGVYNFSTGNYTVLLNRLVLNDENGEEIVLDDVDEEGKKMTVFFGYEYFNYTVAPVINNGVVTEIEVRFTS